MIDATGDVVRGDTIEFTEGVFKGSFKRPVYAGDRKVYATVIKESYGEGRGQHTFTLSVITSSGVDPITAGRQIRRKGRNIYRNGTLREPWANENERDAVAAEKHRRGSAARRCNRKVYAT